jgi:hypothetical protein
LPKKKSTKHKIKFQSIFSIYFSSFWQQHFNEESDRLREQISQLQREYDEQSRSFSDRLQTAATQNSEYLQVLISTLFLKTIFTRFWFFL